MCFVTHVYITIFKNSAVRNGDTSPSTDKVYSLLNFVCLWFCVLHLNRVVFCVKFTERLDPKTNRKGYQLYAMLIYLSQPLILCYFKQAHLTVLADGIIQYMPSKSFSDVSSIECWETRISSVMPTAASAHLPMTWTQT